jgi:hypothetical protein
LLSFGFTLFGVLLVDRYLQYTEGMSVEGAIGMMEEDARQKSLGILELHRNDPALFLCVARKVYKMGQFDARGTRRYYTNAGGGHWGRQSLQSVPQNDTG